MENAIFVFGSNLGGHHGAGAARYALMHKGAILGKAVGIQGESYGIPTKFKNTTNTLYIKVIEVYIDNFIKYAKDNPDTKFQVTRIGCGLAGLKDKDIAPLFRRSPKNCYFDTAWEEYLGKEYNYWGTY